LGQSMDIYGRVAKTTTAACGPRPLFAERTAMPISVDCAPPR
jgi:hypothetical protein